MDEGEKSGRRGINWGKATHDWREDRRDSMEDRKEWKERSPVGKKGGLPRDLSLIHISEPTRP